MSVIRDVNEVRAIYKAAGERGWVLPCICSENLTTTEAVLTAAGGIPGGPRTGYPAHYSGHHQSV